jgi:hypothetical protein
MSQNDKCLVIFKSIIKVVFLVLFSGGFNAFAQPAPPCTPAINCGDNLVCYSTFETFTDVALGPISFFVLPNHPRGQTPDLFIGNLRRGRFTGGFPFPFEGRQYAGIFTNGTTYREAISLPLKSALTAENDYTLSFRSQIAPDNQSNSTSVQLDVRLSDQPPCNSPPGDWNSCGIFNVSQLHSFDITSNGSWGLYFVNISLPAGSPDVDVLTFSCGGTAGGFILIDSINVFRSDLKINDGKADTTICEGDSIVLNSKINSDCYTNPNYLWTPAPGLSCTNCSDPIAAPIETTTYTITVTENGSVSKKSVTVIVEHKPKATGGGYYEACTGDSVQFEILNVKPGESISWSPTVGLSCTTCLDPWVTTTQLADLVYIAIISNDCGSKTLTYNLRHKLTPALASGGDQEICLGDIATIEGVIKFSRGAPIIGSMWVPWDPYLQDMFSMKTDVIGLPATKTYTLHVFNADGCSSSVDVEIVVNQPFDVDAGPDLYVCEGDDGQLNSNVSPFSLSTIRWLPNISYPTGYLSCFNCPNPWVQNVTVPRKYYLEVTTDKGCVSMDSVMVYPKDKPMTDAGPDQMICQGDDLQLYGQDQRISAGKPFYHLDSVAWTPSKYLTDPTIWNPQVLDIQETTDFCLTIYYSNGCNKTDCVKINVLESPGISAGPDISICPEDTDRLIGTRGIIKPLSVQWSPTTGLHNPNDLETDVSGLTTGTYTYTLTVTYPNGCVREDDVQVTVKQGMSVWVWSNATICQGEEVPLFAFAFPLDRPLFGGWPPHYYGPSHTYKWTPSTGLDRDDIFNPKATPNTTTTYTVVVASSWGCKTSGEVTITVNPLPTFSPAIDDPNLCLNECTDYRMITSGGVNNSDITYSWTMNGAPTNTVYPDANDNSKGEICPPSVFGSYNYQVTAEDKNTGCTFSFPTDIVINVRESPQIVDNTYEYCEGGSVKLTPTYLPITGLTYSWSPTTGLSCTTCPEPVANTSNTTTYQVTATNAYGCSTTKNIVVKVNKNPKVTMRSFYQTNDVSHLSNIHICEGEYLDFNPIVSSGTPGYSYQWQPANQTTAPNNNTTRAYPTSSGNFILTVTDSKGCIGLGGHYITVKDIPDVSLSASSTDLCQGESVTLTASSGTPGIYYSWSVSGTCNNPLTCSEITHVPTQTTTYVVTASTGNGCDKTASITVTVNPAPSNVTLTASSNTICEGEESTLTASDHPSYNYTWSPLGSITSNPTRNWVTVKPTTTTIYQVDVSVGIGGNCVETRNITIYVNPSPTVNITNNNPYDLCQGWGVRLYSDGSNDVVDYDWSPSNGSCSGTNCENYDVSPINNTNYVLTVKNNYNCTASDNIQIVVNPNPIARAGNDKVICEGDDVSIGGYATGSNPPYSYLWSPPQGIIGSNTNAYIQVNPYNTTTYTVTVEDSKGCKGTDDVKVTVIPNTNFVNNFNFENGLTPTGRGYFASEIDKESPWFRATGTPDLFDANYNDCDIRPLFDDCITAELLFPCVGIPCNHFGFEEDETDGNHRYAGVWFGVGYDPLGVLGGFDGIIPNGLDYIQIDNDYVGRLAVEGIETRLSQSLVSGTTYTISFSVSKAERGELSNFVNTKSANFVIKISAASRTTKSPSHAPTSATEIHSGSVSQTNGWYHVSFDYTPDTPNNQYLIIESTYSQEILDELKKLLNTISIPPRLKPSGIETFMYIDNVVIGEKCTPSGDIIGDESSQNSDADLEYQPNEASIANFTDGNQRMKLFPNPTSGELNIQLTTDSEEPAYVQVYSLDAKLVSERQVVNTTNNGITTINLSHLPQGIYYVELVQGEQVLRERIVVQ